MEFREWLLTEDPNGVGLGSGDYDYCDYRDADAIPFIVYRGGYIRPTVLDTAYIHVSMYLDAVGPDESSKHLLKIVGDPPAVSVEIPKTSGFDGGFRSREQLLPHMVFGRLWTAAYCWSDDDEGGNRGARRRGVSFWNSPGQVRAVKNEILSMIKGLDIEDEYTPGEKGGLNDPRDYVYEIEGNLMGYDEFVGGVRVGTASGFDPSKLHTMEPGPAKSLLMKGAGISPSPRGVDLSTRMKSYAGD